MEYQTFRGSDVQEALSAVREALGSDALIGSTRRVTNGRAGAFGHTFVEVTAAPASTFSGTAPRMPEVETERTARATRERFSTRQAPPSRTHQQPETLEREVAQLRLLVDELSRGQKPREKALAMLNAVGVEGTLARDLGAGSTRAGRAGRAALRTWLRNRLADRILVQPRIIARPFRQVVACIGPTGVGKTTTLAKLAARASMDFGKSVHVISLDTFRVGAVEQWKRYSDLIGIPLDVARDAVEFHQIISRTSADLVLVDTAGRTVQDDTPTRRLAECLDTVTDMRREVLLVLPAWFRALDAERVVAAYASPRPTALVLTKLDETTEVGGVLHAALPGPIPIAYMCDGPKVPEDIHDAAVDSVVNAVLPREE